MGRFKETAHHHSGHLGWAEITHPFHAFRGQRFRILKTRKVGSVETIILAGSSRGTFAVPREWTDKAFPSPSEQHILEYAALLDLRALIDALIKKDLTSSEKVIESDHVYKWSDRKDNESPRQRQKTLLKKLPPLQDILRGSLVERYKRCGKPGCKCANGRGHGPKYYLTVSFPKRPPEMEYVPEAFQEKVNEYLENYRKAKEILEELSSINRELLRRRERL